MSRFSERDNEIERTYHPENFKKTDDGETIEEYMRVSGLSYKDVEEIIEKKGINFLEEHLKFLKEM